jgi:hypothetical protein
MTAVALRTTPSPGSILLNQVRSLVAYQKWELVAIGIITAIYHLGTVPGEVIGPIQVFRHGALAIAGNIIFLVLCGYWAIRVWDGLTPRDRTVFLSLPADRSWHQALRVVAGALILVVVVSVSWMVGAAISEIVAPGGSWLTSPDQGGGAWPISFFAILNAYLYGSILALLFRKPEVWFVFIVPASVFTLSILNPRAGIPLVNDLTEVVFWFPTGLWSGLGLPTLDIDTGAFSILPDFIVVIMWTAILAGCVYLASRIHRED